MSILCQMLLDRPSNDESLLSHSFSLCKKLVVNFAKSVGLQELNTSLKHGQVELGCR
jgi:hypothetical protein